MNEVVAIVVTYNRKEMLLECIEHLLLLRNAKCDVLVIDNASTDGTGDALISYIDSNKIIYCNTGTNTGGAGGFHFGMTEALKRGYKFLWLMDDDAVPEPDSLSAFLDADRELEGKYGFLSGIAKWTDGSLCKMNLQKTGLKKTITDHTSATVPVIMATFVSFFVKAETVKQIGLPIKEFFIWADDIEYSRRLSLEYPCYAVNGSIVIHNMKSNDKVGIEHDEEDRFSRYKCLYRNEVYIYRREGLKGRLYLFIRVGLHLTRVLFRAKESRLEKIRIILNSYREGSVFKPEIEYYK
ncbi:MAG: glycosyltransferase [Saccharofermentans sp.]|nr:glycosyltransferase [Saccharofermentans sp.]